MKIERARDYRLYYGNPRKRLLDLSLDGGRCLFGHSPTGLSKVYKNAISRSLYHGFPSTSHAEASRILRKRFPGYQPRIFPDRNQARRFLHSAYGIDIPEKMYYSGNHNTEQVQTPFGQCAIWRPFSGIEPTASIVIPVLPLPGAFSPQPVLFATDEPRGEQESNTFTSAVLLVGLTHILRLLQTAERFGSFGSVAKMTHQPARHRQALGRTRMHFHTTQWSKLEPPANSPWLREGPYIIPRKDREEQLRDMWPSIKKRAIREGILIPENPEYLIIIPSMLSDHELGSVRRVLFGGWND